MIPTFGTPFPRGEPVQDPVLTRVLVRLYLRSYKLPFDAAQLLLLRIPLGSVIVSDQAHNLAFLGALRAQIPTLPVGVGT